MRHTITLTGDNAPPTVIDQADYIGDDIVISNGQTGTSVVSIINPQGVTETLIVQFGFTDDITEFILNVDQSAVVQIPSFYWSGPRPGSFTLNLGIDSTLEATPAISRVSNVDIYFEKNAALKIQNTGSSSTPFEAAPTLHGFSAGNKIIAQNASRYEYDGTELRFYAFNRVSARFNVEGLVESDLMFDPTTGIMNYACFLKGTHIATPQGEIKVEELKAGDQVLSLRAGVSTVKWVGYRTLYKAHIPNEDAIRAFPIVFVKGAIADNVPHRDLTLSPGHHVHFDGKLVPAMLLVNGKTIIQDFNRERFEYFHIELEQFDILLAEGVPAESYVDTGNRAMFQNARTVALRPDFGPSNGRAAVPGREVLRPGPGLDQIRRRLLARAESMTNSTRVSHPDLRLKVDGKVMHPIQDGQTPGVVRFALPADRAPVGCIQILSRSAIVRETTHLARRDLRQIGVGLASITVEDNSGRRTIDINDPALSGLHAPQQTDGVTMRWTTGDATIPTALLRTTGHAVLELKVLRTYRYWEPAPTELAQDLPHRTHSRG